LFSFCFEEDDLGLLVNVKVLEDANTDPTAARSRAMNEAAVDTNVGAAGQVADDEPRIPPWPAVTPLDGVKMGFLPALLVSI
jgi:hypothetical protein